MKYLHIEHMDGGQEHVYVLYGKVNAQDGVLAYLERNNERELPRVIRAWPLGNIRRYWFSDNEDR